MARSEPSCCGSLRPRSTGRWPRSAAGCGVRGRQGTKPGSILERHIPIRTFAEWDDRRPGFCEADLVAQPQMKLVSETRRGAKVSKRFDVARTPYQRVLESPDIADQAKEALRAVYLGLNPAQLKRDVIQCQDRLIQIATTKAERGGGKPTGSPLQEDGLLEAGFEDIFGEATGDGFEDILT